MTNIGRILYGGNYDGSELWSRGDFHDKRIEAEGVDWIIARDMVDGRPDFSPFADEKDKQDSIARWSVLRVPPD